MDRLYPYWREYHEATKHTVERLRQSRHQLDWATMPDPFRHYEGTPVLDLPADPPSPEIPALDVLQGKFGTTPVTDGAMFLSQLLYHSAAISASKRVPSTGARYALRVNPSSGNLHPTEFHFVTRGLQDWPDGLYHYRPSSHMAEQRARGHIDLSDAPLTFVLTSIAWREAWKYQARAYRYCLHDIGHASQAIELAARAMGCQTRGIMQFPDDEIAQQCRLSDDEWPMLLIKLDNPLLGVRKIPGEAVWYGGEPNRLSPSTIPYPLIDAIHTATKLVVRHDIPEAQTPVPLPTPMPSSPSFGEVVRTRRSALDFRGGDESIPHDHLLTLLAAATPLLPTGYIRLYLYVHRVDSLPPGLYSAELDLLKPGDQRVIAAALSLQQDLAGNACVAFSMVADLERATRDYGDRGYRYSHFEAGAIGQRLYLAAEALGLRATGIGAFYDDEVHRYLGLSPEQGQVVYHFAVGYPVPDPRLEA